MTPADRQRLQQTLLTFDEVGLVALSNKGLVRRAQKDYDVGGLSWEESPDAIVVRGPGWTVTMPATGPAHARDDTQATGMTRQILTATIYLRDLWCGSTSEISPGGPATENPAPPKAVTVSESNAPTFTAESVPAIADKPAENSYLPSAIRLLEQLTADDLVKWAGKTVVAAATSVMRLSPTVEFEQAFGLTIRFPQHETEIRLIPQSAAKSVSSLLEQFLSNAPKGLRRQWIVTAVLAWRTAAGISTSLDKEADSQPIEVREGRRRALASTSELLEALIRTGLAHVSQRMVQRLLTLSVAANSVHLPRLSRSLRSIADEVELILTRDAKGHTPRLFDLMGSAHALTLASQRAGDSPRDGLIGQHRSEYTEIESLELAGVGAFPWRTSSGFVGVTALFWDAANDRFWTWTDSRPEAGPGRFHVQESYEVGSPWNKAPALRELCRRRFELRQVKANSQGRLSASQQTIYQPGPADHWPPAAFGSRDFVDWRALLQHVQQQQPIGLRMPDPLQRLVVVRPTAWGTRVFDETHQRLLWTILDCNGRPLQLIVRWEDSNEEAIEFLEAIKPDRDRITGVVGRADLAQRELILEPLVLLSDGTPRGDRLLNPGFDIRRLEYRQSTLLERLRQKYGRGQANSQIRIDEEAHFATGSAQLSRGVEIPLADLEARLLRLAETGLHRLDDLHRDQLRELHAQFDRLGLNELAGHVQQLHDTASPASLLWCRYLCRLHREAAFEAIL